MSYGPNQSRERKESCGRRIGGSPQEQLDDGGSRRGPGGGPRLLREDGRHGGWQHVVCQDKARSAARFKRPTKAFQDMLAAGGEGLRVLRIKGAVPVDGGLPIMMGGKIVGAVGLSGGTSAQDGQCAKAGVDAVS